MKDLKYIKEVFIDLLKQVLENKIDRKTVSKLIRERVDSTDVFNIDDSCIITTYCVLENLNHEYCTTTNTELVYLKECLEGKRVYSYEDKWEFVLNGTERVCKLVPYLNGKELDLDDFDKYTPEKFEYYNGLIFGNKISAVQLLNLLLYNLGIETAIKLAPKEVWEEAIKLYYKD